MRWLSLCGVILSVALIYHAWKVNAVVTNDDHSQLAQYRTDWKTCMQNLDGLSRLPIKGGGFIEHERIRGVHYSVAFDGYSCGVDMIEGAFYWDGKRALPKGMVSPDIKGLATFHLTATLGPKPERCIPGADCSSNNVESRPIMTLSDSIPVELENYPNYQFRLKYPPPDARNRPYFRFLILQSGTAGVGQRLVVCDDFIQKNYKAETVLADSWVTMKLADLRAIKITDKAASCIIGFQDLKFNSGAGRLMFSVMDLNVVNDTVLSIEKYLSESIE